MKELQARIWMCAECPAVEMMFNRWEKGLEGLSYSELARVGMKRSAKWGATNFGLKGKVSVAERLWSRAEEQAYSLLDKHSQPWLFGSFWSSKKNKRIKIGVPKLE